ncbi:MAG: DNA-directed RNA polymerase specialized sigma24 family protein [Mariniblastus sp.]|jgi:DNA-directed RNA polymerase specialized sigma24 family protein
MTSSHPNPQFRGNRQFETTQWNLVKAINVEDSVASSTALQELCQTYWYPLYSYVRGQGHDANTAADLTQAFFADLLQREDLKKVDPSLGKFRSFLLTAIKHFLMNQWDKRNAQKRGGGRSPLSLNFEEADGKFALDPFHAQTPELIFQKQWARTLLERVNESLREEFQKRGKVHQFDRLRKFLAGKSNEETVGAAAAQLGMSEVAVKVAVHRMRQRFGLLLREEIEQTVSTPEEVDTEIQQLFEVLRN